MSTPDWDCGDDPVKQRAFTELVIRELERIEEDSIKDPIGVERLTRIVAATASRDHQLMTRRELLEEQKASKAQEQRRRGRPPMADQNARRTTLAQMAARDVQRMREGPHQIFYRLWQRRNRERHNPPSAEAIAAERHGITERQVLNRLKKPKTLRPD